MILNTYFFCSQVRKQHEVTSCLKTQNTFQYFRFCKFAYALAQSSQIHEWFSSFHTYSHFWEATGKIRGLVCLLVRCCLSVSCSLVLVSCIKRVENGKSGPDINEKTWRQQASGSRWPCDLRCGSAIAWLLGLRVRIPLTAWMFVSCACCVLCR